jgi:hypothetical protein
MARKPISLPQPRSFLETKRRDRWWLFPTITFAYFMAFIIYSTWAALQGNHYWFADGGRQYLSPFFAPVVMTDPTQPGSMPAEHAWFGEFPKWWPVALATPAILILWAPGLFRFTCYYYRGAYYKAFWADPFNCAVGEPRKSYWGERWLPLVLQNIHRYFLYVALLFIIFLSYEAWISFRFVQEDGSVRFGVGVGSIVLLLNVVFLGLYTFGCHSFRHIVGGFKDRISGNRARYKTYQCVSCMNRWHMQWAWVSLFWVGFADVYIRLCSMGIWTDYMIVF